MSSSETTPLQISGYFVLPLRLPPLPSYPISATHFLYIASHQPRVPTPTAARSLFLVNVPFDATASHIKHLLSTQLGLPNGRVEDVQFEAESKRAQNDDETSGSQSKLTQKGKKRKHSMEYKDFAEFSGGDLPHVWDRDLRSPGSTAVVMLVDRASMEAVIKAIKRIRKEGREPIWGEGVEDSQPALGLSRAFHMFCGISDKRS